MDLLIGTHNQGKLKEYQTLFNEVEVRLVGLQDVGLSQLEVEETGDTFGENAAKKALAYTQASGLFALADDTGLVIDALDGRPGLYSARYGPPDLDDRGRRLLVLSQMQNVPLAQRTARFMCVIAVANPKTMSVYTASGTCEGHIALADDVDGEYGFGYDAIFIPTGAAAAWSRFSKEEKNKISHRGTAARQLVPVLKRLAAEFG